MASTANLVPTSNSSAATTAAPASTPKDGSSRPTMKQAGSSKMVDRSRKESPADAARPSSAPRAWKSGTNPITQRTLATSQQNGGVVQTKNSSTNRSSNREPGLTDKQSHERLRFLLAGTIGLSVVLTTKAGDKYEGVFAAATEVSNTTRITLKMTKKVRVAITQPNGAAAREPAFVGTNPDYSMAYDLRDVADLTIPEFSLPESVKQANGASSSFQTDADISGNLNRGERALQPWVSDGPDAIDLSLESGTASGWDQFATHDKMFGNNSTYSEETYTTVIDRNAPGFRRREAEAARLAREIESQASSNAHMREERGQAAEHDLDDEESKYSGVRREDRTFPSLPRKGHNTYTPPALRAPSGHATVVGAPIDPAIISAQVSWTDAPRATAPSQIETPTGYDGSSTAQARGETPAANGLLEKTVSSEIDVAPSSSVAGLGTNTLPAVEPGTPASVSRKTEVDPPSQGVENKVLDQFRQFANAERARLAERKRAQANQDRTAKINDLVRFSKTFKLKTPIPTDLVGILAKDPAKQEAILERAQKDHNEARSATTSPSAATKATSTAAPPKFDKSQIPPPIPERGHTLGRGGSATRGGLGRGGRSSQQPIPLPGAPVAPRGSGYAAERKASQHQGPPAPIPLPDPRLPSGSATDQSGLTSPRGSNTPTSAISTKFNVRALEFRPTAPAFNPGASSNLPSSPAPVQRTTSVTTTASPASFFGSRKPKPASDRLNVATSFDPTPRMRHEVEAKRAENPGEPGRDYAGNGGIPNAFHTQPVWTVKESNSEKTHTEFFVRSTQPASSPAQSRAGSTHPVPPHSHFGHPVNGTHGSHVGTSQHGMHAAPHPYGGQFDEHRMHMSATSPQVYPSPNMASRQMSAYASPMSHPAQLVFSNQPYYGGPGGPVPMHMRQYPHNPGMLHGQSGQPTAPMMMQQSSNGPYVSMSQQYNQMPLYYTPNPAPAFPQQNGYPSPGRGAPMMMQQSSQQSHHGGQPNMYLGGQSGAMVYGQQATSMRGGYGGHQNHYGGGHHHAHHMAQRTMSSSGYGPKSGLPMPSNSVPPTNAGPSPATFPPMDSSGTDTGK